ncbi:transmembrane protein 276 [Hyla sarda]|uniref:transmembrane protein 276 n=1 Tax=Hyla sarda TaxID=327740 RepID=UPI0024C31BA5|nr:transmembrane protein 276 [Hyla sarda]
MFSHYKDVVLLMSRSILCAVSFVSAFRTLQVHRGASAGFLLHGLSSVLGVVCLLLPGLSVDCSRLWVSSIIGLPLLVFSFFWLNGDHFTANLALMCALLLAACSPQLTYDTRLVGMHLTHAGASLSILVISVFTGNRTGLLGSLALGTWGLISFLDTGRVKPLCIQVGADCALGAAILAFQMALKTPL